MKQISCNNSGKTQIARFGYRFKLNKVEEGYDLDFGYINHGNKLILKLPDLSSYYIVQKNLENWFCEALKSDDFPPLPVGVVFANRKIHENRTYEDDVVFFSSDSKAEKMAYEYGRKHS